MPESTGLGPIFVGVTLGRNIAQVTTRGSGKTVLFNIFRVKIVRMPVTLLTGHNRTYAQKRPVPHSDVADYYSNTGIGLIRRSFFTVLPKLPILRREVAVVDAAEHLPEEQVVVVLVTRNLR